MEFLRVCMCDMAYDGCNACIWQTRAGRKTDADFKAWKKLPYGIVTTIGSIGTPLSLPPSSCLRGVFDRSRVYA